MTDRIEIQRIKHPNPYEEWVEKKVELTPSELQFFKANLQFAIDINKERKFGLNMKNEISLLKKLKALK